MNSEQKNRAEKEPSFLYFISFGKGPIKIGRTKNLRKRLSEIQISIPYEAEFLGGYVEDEVCNERAVHDKFDHLRLRGEWFDRHPQLIEFIMAIRNPQLHYWAHNGPWPRKKRNG